MDSMRSLNSSLPRSAPQNRRRQPNSELLQAFKAAALSVTQLYKTAASDNESARESHSAGYLDALDDLLAFLDERNIGLGDGEGWQVRTWATQQHQSIINTSPNNIQDSATPEEEEKSRRSTSPAAQQKPNPQYQTASAQTEPPATESNTLNPVDVFQFASPTSPQQSNFNFSSSTHASPAVRVEVIPRPARASQHRGGHHMRGADRLPAVSLGTLGHGAGSRRRAPLHEFFDISGPGTGKDGPSPGKRSRMT